MSGLLVALFVAFAACAAVAAPLFFYTTSLACFGLAHVLIELRYVDGRFGRRLPTTLWLWSAVVIAAVVALRGLRVVGFVVPAGTTWELGLVAGLFVIGAVVAGATRRVAGGVGGLLAGGVAVGAVLAPIETLLTLALLHNLTPLGFILERAAPGRRLATGLVSTLIFVGVPLGIASGVPTALLGARVDIASSFFGAGDLSSHLGVYLWPSWQTDDVAVARFSAAVCAQLLHYGAVILWLPRQLGDDDAPRLPWPPWRTLLTGVVVLGAGLGIHFAADFAGARAAYGLPAAVHAWLELPVLLVAFAIWPAAASAPVTAPVTATRAR